MVWIKQLKVVGVLMVLAVMVPVNSLLLMASTVTDTFCPICRFST